jgi:hypothetical protein
MTQEHDPVWFWKNYRMGTELQISGSFIYNAIYCLDQIESFHHEHDCFEFLYNTSVGLERLFKIAVILIEHDDTISQKDFEKSLITHSCSTLLTRINKKHELKLGKTHNRFLALLDDFYKTTRYNRFNISSVYSGNRDKFGINQFLEIELKDDHSIESEFSKPFSIKTRKFLGKIIGKLSTQVYEIIRTEAHRNGTFTYEIAYSSKAYKIFMEKKFDFVHERLTQREALLHILRNGIDGNYREFLNTIPSINLEGYTTDKYIQSIFGYDLDCQVKDEVETIYEDYKQDKERTDALLAIGSGIRFDDFEDFLDEL